MFVFFFLPFNFSKRPGFQDSHTPKENKLPMDQFLPLPTTASCLAGIEANQTNNITF
jgi:hypothetical protein